MTQLSEFWLNILDRTAIILLDCRAGYLSKSEAYQEYCKILASLPIASDIHEHFSVTVARKVLNNRFKQLEKENNHAN